MLKKIYTKHYLLLSLIIFMALLLPLIHTSAFRYTFIEPKFAFYDVIGSFITLYYFYYKKTFHISLLTIMTFTVLGFMILSISQSANIVYSFELILRFFNFVILIALLYDFLQKNIITLEQVGNVLLLIIFIFILYYLYGTEIVALFTSNTSFSPIGHINYTAHVLNIWIPLLLINFMIQKNNFLKYGSLFLMFFLIDMLIISGSRGSILGLILSEVFVIVILFFKYKRLKLYPIITLMLLSSFFMHKYFEPSSIKKISNKIEIVQNSISKKGNRGNKTSKIKQSFFDYQKLNKASSFRLNAYNNTFDMIVDNPWGVGAGNYEYLHPKYAKVGTPFRTPYVNEKMVWTNPHNIILKFISELNWLGGIIFVLLLLLFSKLALSLVLYGQKLDYIIVIAFSATMFHSMLSAVFLTPVQLFYASFLFALFLYRYNTLIGIKILFKFNKIYVKPFLIIIPVFFILFHSSKYYNNQFTTQKNFKYLEAAIKLNPYNDKAIMKQANFSAYLKHDHSLAIHYLNKYLKLYPYNISAHIKKANFQYRLNRNKEALKTINNLLSFDKKNKKMLDLKKRVLRRLKR